MYPVKSLRAALYVIQPAGKMKLGYQPVMHVHNAMMPVKLTAIEGAVTNGNGEGERDGESKAANASSSSTSTTAANREIPKKDELVQGDIVYVQLTPAIARGLSVDTVDRCPKLARFVLRDGHTIVAAGYVASTEYD